MLAACALTDCQVAQYIPFTRTRKVEEQQNMLFYYMTTMDLIKEKSMSAAIQEIKQKVDEIGELKENWDGYGACSIPRKVIHNTFKFIDCLFDSMFEMSIDPENITPTPYGSIEIDLETKNGLVSLEIGKREIGFFTRYANKENLESDGIETDFKSIPGNLEKALSILFS